MVQNPAYKFGLVMLGGFDVLALAGDIEHFLCTIFGQNMVDLYTTKCHNAIRKLHLHSRPG